MKLSIITINLNNKSGLQKTLESIVAQTFVDYELIVIDGASTDGSLDVIKEFETKINHSISEPDNGIYNAMNKGITFSNGDFLYFLNSGDYFSSEHVLANIFKNDPNTAFICGDFTTDNGGLLKLQTPYRSKDWRFAMYDLYTGDLCHQAFFIRKDMFIRYGLYDERLKISADWKLFFIAIAIRGEGVLYNDIDIVVYNMEGLSSTIGGKAIHEERVLVVKEELPKATAVKLERLYYLEQNSYITDIICSRKWLFNSFRAFCKLGRMLGFLRS